ncbi:MAG: four helix bundle protein [Balneolaceae bacterium]|nr:four helix bundle protein [Balneolaceae bacterium]MBO6547041.1 four helix bundle protein [Balneolaceae bacterium]MBO6648012.1 four helix bundle protein [Balneolaceae bacterium]
MIKSYKDLEVYCLSFELAMEIFELTRNFPKEEVYSLTSQIVRSSRSVSANITEGWAKRRCENEFKRHLIYALGSTAETERWIKISLECGYISKEKSKSLTEKVNVVGKMLTKLDQNWRT